jgi:hypothetical protein
MIREIPDSGGRTDFATGAVRDLQENKGLPHLIPKEALRRLSVRFAEGARKYGRNNWQKGIPLSSYIDSAHRHIWDFEDGEPSEDHLAAAIWNLACLLQTEHWIKQGRLPEALDDINRGPNTHEPQDR